ncbi:MULTISPECIES: acetyl-CoA carboxylase biotin carboxylase subunit [Burkholderia]|uniref:acetyl-CoA carboxylase biotin carboxylase subunit n=1 Tax=Burkholderia TaxID=32008 RepID=UPI000751EE29|nr:MULTISPECIES: biotin carboxylase N-terminal domain-containing protein [Burkholderia]AOJ69866.1 biotin carboxylase [Burkholderia savannae]KVG41297.1 biotin carboxylase [Burkholderia sp. MSMB0265]KVG84444.1 biotin carboxylase [Burkholderia sp. MSMB2040]KVG95597.1 biotin carboxylase [Burkholderia sp. MSMB2041]KVH01248.1 biotin carboxylase [Burkholderia sp. MSMB2042]
MSVKRVLLCCRGEIALRFVRTCRLLDIETVAIYTDDDDNAGFVLAADSAFHIDAWNPATLIDTVISIAQAVRADAVAPGYGPLAENAAFAAACAAEGLVFVGPHAEAIRRTGDKIEARAAAQRAAVPVVPGATVANDAQAATAAAEIGFPILIKAALGGGGRGIRVVERAEQFDDALAEVRREAKLAFGSDDIYLERFLGERIRHIEVQVLGDRRGNLLHLGTRECSVQRRRQKIVEEAPAPALSDALRERLHESALAVAREVGYDNAGTVEFLVDGNERFYFIEMNARIQVEHPVSEAVTGVDIVEQMLRAAAGEPLSLSQDDVRLRGSAIEFRICAEDAHADFLPTGGGVTHYRVPEGPGIRIDSGVHAGARQSTRFDSLCLKLIVDAATRERALRRARNALRELMIAGFSTNVPFHLWLVDHPPFKLGRYDLSVTRDFPFAHRVPDDTARVLHALAALAAHCSGAPLPARAGEPAVDASAPSAWVTRNDRRAWAS